MRTQYSPLLELLEPVVSSLGFILHGIERFSSGSNEMLRVYIDGTDGVDLDDCVSVHAPLERALSSQGVDLSLEVSSPGVDRVLFTPAQLAGAVGSDVSVRTAVKIDGRRRFVGRLLSVDESGDAAIMVDGTEYNVAVSEIERAKLLLSDKL